MVSSALSSDGTVTDGHVPHRARTRPIDRTATVAAGVGFAFIVAHDGTPLWQAARLVVVAALTALAWRATTGNRRLPAITAALAIALMAIPVGIGIGMPHLAKTGLTPLSVAGVAVLLAGLVSLTTGTGRLVRAGRRRATLPAATAAVAATLLLTWTLGQAVAATNVPRLGLEPRSPATVGLAYRDVTFPATDSVALSAWYIPTRNGAAVALLHGAGSTRSSVLDHAVVLARHGYGVLVYDARGHGRSGGRAMDFGWFGDRDLGGAVAFLQHQAGVDPTRIGAVGMSMGGEQAVGAAAGNESIRGVVAEGATNRVAADKAWLSDEFGWRGALSERVENLTYAFADVLTTAGPPISLHDAVRAAAPRRVLLIAGGSVPDEARAAHYIQQASPDTVDVWVAPRTGHTRALTEHPREWEHRVITFLDRALGGSGEQGGTP